MYMLARARVYVLALFLFFLVFRFSVFLVCVCGVYNVCEYDAYNNNDGVCVDRTIHCDYQFFFMFDNNIKRGDPFPFFFILSFALSYPSCFY